MRAPNGKLNHEPNPPEAASDSVAPPDGSQSIRPKALIFTLFGDYIRERGGEIWTGSLIHLMRRLGVPSAQAVRSTLSRMSQRGWLQSRKRGRRSYYSLTPRGQRLLDEGARRIFEGRPEARHWDGHWRLLSYHIPDDLTPLRARLRQELGWIGFGRLDSSLYVAPYDYAHELAALFDRLEIHEHVDLFVGEFRGPRSDADIARRAWDLAGIDSAYRTFLTTWQPFF
ncbi:MAG TPA: hypothetical protein VER55_05195, partial [Ardenticatenaceae bacterium]|nr:hypothetical protein [Ardenticatenaceae bacterium]